MTRIAGMVLAGLLLIVATWWAAPPPAYACSCAYQRDDPELTRIADVIFVGTVVGDRTLGETRTYTFTVDRVYKGQAHATQKLTTHAQGPACGLELNGPGPYLVYAYQEPEGAEALHANSCGGSREGGPPANLGEGYPPLPGRSGISPAWIAVPIVALSAAFGFAALAWRRRLTRPDR
jgi:hypothetical protein